MIPIINTTTAIPATPATPVVDNAIPSIVADTAIHKVASSTQYFVLTNVQLLDIRVDRRHSVHFEAEVLINLLIEVPTGISLADTLLTKEIKHITREQYDNAKAYISFDEAFTALGSLDNSVILTEKHVSFNGKRYLPLT